MFNVVVFSVVVILSGWILGYILSLSMKGKTTPSPVALMISLTAVAIPTLMAFILASESFRVELLHQFIPVFSIKWYFLAIALPFIGFLICHLAGVISAKTKIDLFPKKKEWVMGLGMLPMVLLWGLLEEIGWRAFLAVEIGKIMQPLIACFVTGLLWGIWHAPQMFTNPKLKEIYKEKLKLGMFLWVSQCVALGGMLGWLQFRSGSFLIPAIAHGLVNMFETISDASVGDNKSPIWWGFNGIPAIVFTFLVSFIGFFFF